MKRWLLITISIVLGLKLIAHLIVGMLDKPSIHLSKALTFEDRMYDFLHWDSSSNNGATNRIPPYNVATKPPIPKPMPPPPPTPPPAGPPQFLLAKKAIPQKTEDQLKAEKEKEDKNRRKKRRKNLEKLANGAAVPIPRYYVPALPQPVDVPYIAAGPYQVAQPPIQNPVPTPNTVNRPATVVPVGGGTSAQGQSQNIAAWYLKTLIASHSAQVMKDFIKLYLSKQVLASDFFGVLSNLVKTNTPALMQLAVGAAIQTPSTGAFIVLSDASFVSDTTTQNGALQSLQTYQQPSSLNYLLGVFKTTDNQAKSRALDALNQIIVSVRTDTGSTLKSAQGSLNPFLTVLQTIAAQNTIPDLQAKAFQTLQNLQNVLNSNA